MMVSADSGEQSRPNPSADRQSGPACFVACGMTCPFQNLLFLRNNPRQTHKMGCRAEHVTFLVEHCKLTFKRLVDKCFQRICRKPSRIGHFCTSMRKHEPYN